MTMVVLICVGVGSKVDVFCKVGEAVDEGCDVNLGWNGGNTVLCRPGLTDFDVIVEDVYAASL
jgi:hypothetical protein